MFYHANTYIFIYLWNREQRMGFVYMYMLNLWHITIPACSLAGVVGQVWPIHIVCSCVKNCTALVYPLYGWAVCYIYEHAHWKVWTSASLVWDPLSPATTRALLLATKRDMHLVFNKEQISANSCDSYMCWLLNLVAQHPYTSQKQCKHM